MDIPTESINEHINFGEVRDCYMGSDILGKLHCPRSALIKNKFARYINGKKSARQSSKWNEKVYASAKWCTWLNQRLDCTLMQERSQILD